VGPQGCARAADSASGVQNGQHCMLAGRQAAAEASSAASCAAGASVRCSGIRAAECTAGRAQAACSTCAAGRPAVRAAPMLWGVRMQAVRSTYAAGCTAGHLRHRAHCRARGCKQAPMAQCRGTHELCRRCDSEAHNVPGLRTCNCCTASLQRLDVRREPSWHEHHLLHTTPLTDHLLHKPQPIGLRAAQPY
jgi:hypothetical protein